MSTQPPTAPPYAQQLEQLERERASRIKAIDAEFRGRMAELQAAWIRERFASKEIGQ